MDFIFQSLTDLALRRVYKFVLKQTIGKFLQDELLINQLEVESREGVVRVRDLHLDPDKINAELHEIPFRVDKASVNLIEVHLSYSTLLSESCTFTVDTVDVVLRNNVQCRHSVDERTTHSKSDNPAVSDDYFMDSLSDEAEEGLSFIAQWIEIIISKLRVNLRALNVRWSQNGSRGLTFGLRGLEFCNGDPTLYSNNTSLEISQLVRSRVDLASSLLSSAKIGKFEQFFLSVWDSEKEVVVVSLEKSTVKIRVEPSSGGGGISDCDCAFGTITSRLDLAILGLFLEVVEDFFRIPSSTSINDARANFGCLDRVSKQLVKDDGLQRAFDNLAMKRSIKDITFPISSGFSGSILDCETIDSEEEFDNEDLSDFHDTIEAPVRTSLMQSSFHVGSSVMPSTLFATTASVHEEVFPLRVRVSVPELTLSLLREDKTELRLHCEDCVLVCNLSLSHSSISKLSLALRTVQISEVFRSDLPTTEQALLTFFRNQNSREIFSAPDIEISLITQNSNTTVDVSFEPLIVSLDIPSVNVWSGWLECLKMPSMNGNTSSSSFKLSLAVPSVHVFLRGNPSVEMRSWNDLRNAIRLDVAQSMWRPLNFCSQTDRKKHLDTSQGGLNFSFDNISMGLEFGSVSSFVVHTRCVTLGVFLRVGEEVFSAIFLTASESGNESLRIRLGASTVEQARTLGGSSSEGHIDDMGPQKPALYSSHTLLVHVPRLDVDIQQREYNALILISDLLVSTVHNLKEEGKSLTDGGAGFGLLITTTEAFISLSENEFEWWNSSALQIPKGDILGDLCRLLRNNCSSAESEEVSSKFKLCVAIREPRIEFISVDRDIFVSLRADDLSIFELMPTQYAALVKARFDFFAVHQFKSHTEGEDVCTPTVHRAYVHDVQDKTNLSQQNNTPHLADHTSFGRAFEVRFLLSSSYAGTSLVSVKSLHFFIDFYDIVINHDPASQWLLRLVTVLSPVSINQLCIGQLNSLLGKVEQMEIALDENGSRVVQLAKEKIVSLASNMIAREENGESFLPFETTKMSVRVRDSLIHYHSPVTKSSLVLSVNVVTLGSTMVTNSELFSLKMSLSALSFFLKQNTNPWELPIGSCWKTKAGYLQIFLIDFLSTVVTIRESDHSVALDFTLGTCIMRGSIASLKLVSQTLQSWLSTFEEACKKSENIVHKRNHVPVSSDRNGVRVSLQESTVLENELEQLISDDLINGVEPTENDLNSSQHFKIQNDVVPTLHNLVMEDFYSHEQDISDDDERWVPDYGLDSEHEVELDPQQSQTLLSRSSSVSLEKFEPNAAKNHEEYGFSSVFLFSRPSKSSPEDVELRPITLPPELEAEAEVALTEHAASVQPGLTTAQLAELEDLEKVWQDVQAVVDSGVQHGSISVDEQRAYWYGNDDLEIDHLYVAPALPRWEKIDARPEIERTMMTDIVVSLQGDFKIQFFQEEITLTDERITVQHDESASIEIILREVKAKVFSYVRNATMTDEVPRERIEFQTKEFMIVFSRGNERQKLLGAWRAPQRPFDDTRGMLVCTLLTFENAEGKKEMRVRLALQPLRIFLSENIFSFIKNCFEYNIDATPIESTTNTVDGAYFQAIVVEETAMKIDYRASHVNVAALHNGDYLQLLNVFPIDGLEIVLKSVRLHGEGNPEKSLQKLVEIWIRDIYRNQLHKVLAGAAPLKGLINIGQDVHNIFASPSNKSSQSQVVRHLQKSTKVLATTIAREALGISHKLSHLVARTITDLADPNAQACKTRPRQPRGLNEGLTEAFGCVSREVHSAADAVIAVPIRQFERNGITGAMTSVVRALPVALLRPIAGVAEGFAYTLLGFRNQLDPITQRDEEEIFNVDFQNVQS